MKDEDKLLDHNYDGIQEYDNALPLWWVWLFIITIVIAVVYPFLYDIPGGKFASQTIEQEMRDLAQLKAGSNGAGAELDQAALLALTKNSEVSAKGAQIFASKCVACHGDKGQGVIGPNLTDDNWIHGGKITDIKNTVTNGVLAKGMLAWKDQLSADEINSVVAFVWNLHGTKPPNPKAPEGEVFKRD